MLCNLRGENFENDYKPFFGDWLNYWAKNGFYKEQILEMIEVGKSLSKYGSTKLAIGDLISKWEKNNKEVSNIKFSDFVSMFKKIAKERFEILDRACLEYTGFNFIAGPEAKKLYDAVIRQIDDIELEKQAIRNNKEFSVSQMFVDLRKRNEINEEAQKIINEHILKFALMVKEKLHGEFSEEKIIKMKKKKETVRVYNTLGFALWLTRYIHELEKGVK